MEPSKTRQTRSEQHHNTLRHLYILCYFANYALCLLVVHSRVVEGSWEGIAGCIVHVDMHGEYVCCW